MTEFVTFVENNFKEREKFVFYLRWTDNEDALTWLHDTIKRACYDELSGDVSSFEMNIAVKFKEEIVDQHCNLRFGQYTAMFQKVDGTCMMWKLWRKWVNIKNSFEVARWLDDKFYAARIRDTFHLIKQEDEEDEE